MHPNKPLKDLFNKNNAWLTYLNQHIGPVRDAVMNLQKCNFRVDIVFIYTARAVAFDPNLTRSYS
ncbi:hypothetical protein AKG98_2893 [Moritella sp. JT01]|nr:hypothetical protein AKG98_2893 [Moritella sp. JT01]